MIYFDNAATTFFKPKAVVDAVTECLTRGSFNANRGSGGRETSVRIFETRRKIAETVNCDPVRVIFCGGCTAALNAAIIGGCKPKGNVIISVWEHNSVIRPLKEMERKGLISLTAVQPDESGFIRAEKILKAARANTYMAVISHVSNVTGRAQDIEEIGFGLSRYGIKFVVDGAQSVGYIPVDMRKCKIDALCFPAHKGFHGMQGLGVMCLGQNFSPAPICFGGTGSDSYNVYQPDYLPDKYESGTLNTPGILALGAASDWWNAEKEIHLANIAKLQAYLLDGLKNIKNAAVYSDYNGSGIISFGVGSRDSGEISDILYEKYGIVTRSGLHCAPLTHKYLGTEKTGLVRASLSGENTVEECDAFLKAVRETVGE